jgi:hypothetical protein
VTCILLLWAGACHCSADSGIDLGHLEADWTGADTGKISAPATAEWCEGQRLLEIRAIRGDTGFALVLYPPVILSPDTYPVRAPAGSDSAVPSARVALRWFGATTVSGFQGDSGAVVLERADSGELSGTVVARAISVVNNSRIAVTGAFQDLTVVDAKRGCIPETSDSAPALDDEPVDDAEGDDEPVDEAGGDEVD